MDDLTLFISSALGAGFVIGMIVDGWSALWGLFWSALRRI